MIHPLFTRGCTLLVTAFTVSWLQAGEALHDHEMCGEGHGHGHAASSTFGFNLTEHWLDPWSHRHFSPRGTPYIHHFGFEPAYTGRDLLPSYAWAELDEGDEHEIEVELEWAFTRRLGVVLEQAYIFEQPDGEDDVDGWGDFVIVPRALIAEYDRFLATLNLEIEVPTGSDEVEAGEEWHLAPSIVTWIDLGSWWALTTNAGFEFALESDETEFFFNLGLSKAFRLREEMAASGGAKDAHSGHGPCDHGHGHGHGLAGILAVVAELSGEVVIDGEEEEEDEWALEALLGLDYAVTDAFNIRAGYSFPLNSNSELEHGVRAGLIMHF